jgi:MacB-like periplasmic core domain
MRGGLRGVRRWAEPFELKGPVKGPVEQCYRNVHRESTRCTERTPRKERIVGPGERQPISRTLACSILRGRTFTAADNETTEPVAIVNEAFVKRFFKSGEDPLDQHFGLDVPENAGTFRIVGVVRDAKFAGWGLNRPAMPMFFVPLAQNVDYKQEGMNTTELRSHVIGGIMLVTGTPPGTLEPLLSKTLSEVDSQPDDHQRQNHAAAN